MVKKITNDFDNIIDVGLYKKSRSKISEIIPTTYEINATYQTQANTPPLDKLKVPWEQFSEIFTLWYKTPRCCFLQQVVRRRTGMTFLHPVEVYALHRRRRQNI